MRAVSWAMAAGLLLAAACGNEGSQRLAEPVTIEGDAIPAPLGGETGDASRGKAVFTDREQGHCVLCHAVPPAISGARGRQAEGSQGGLEAGWPSQP